MCFGTACADEITLEVETLEVTSKTFEVRIFVKDVPPLEWLPRAQMRLRWDPSTLAFVEARRHPSLDPTNDQVLAHEWPDRPGEVGIDLQCDFGCGTSIIPEPRQAILVLAFDTLDEASSTVIEVLEDLPFFGAKTVVSLPGTGDAVQPLLVDGVVTFLKFLRGDWNQSGVLDISDGIGILGFLFLGSRLHCLDLGDANDDGKVDVSDAVFLLVYLFAGGPAPPPPLEEAGLDPTRDSLFCSEPP